jgi:hypothetical protein
MKYRVLSIPVTFSYIDLNAYNIHRCTLRNMEYYLGVRVHMTGFSISKKLGTLI